MTKRETVTQIITNGIENHEVFSMPAVKDIFVSDGVAAKLKEQEIRTHQMGERSKAAFATGRDTAAADYIVNTLDLKKVLGDYCFTVPQLPLDAKTQSLVDTGAMTIDLSPQTITPPRG